MTRKFKTPYCISETYKDMGVITMENSDVSVFLKIENPCPQYCGDDNLYSEFTRLYDAIVKTMGEYTVIQKQDIFSKKKFKSDGKCGSDYLSRSYERFFCGREYTDIETYLILTKKAKSGTFFTANSKSNDEFFLKIEKVISILKASNIPTRILTENEARIYIRRMFAMNFSDETFSVNNFVVGSKEMAIGDKVIKNMSLVDIEEVNLPATIKPVSIDTSIGYGDGFPTDIMTFLQNVPGVSTLVYNQIIEVPNQNKEKSALTSKMKRHGSFVAIDAENQLAVDDIINVQTEIATSFTFLVYTHFNIMFCGVNNNLNEATNYIEQQLFTKNIVTSKRATNQFELYMAGLPGNSGALRDYDKFLTTLDVAGCLLYKEAPVHSENKSGAYNFFYNDRSGVPISIDLFESICPNPCNNRNKFVLGPSGSGKSFFMNTYVRQCINQNIDVVLVDTGNSYIGLAEYYGAKYITYTEDKPITMNPFRIKRTELNIEKITFLKNLITLLWKGSDGICSKIEDSVLSMTIKGYYANYFADGKMSEKEKNDIVEKMKQEWYAEDVHEECKNLDQLKKKIDAYLRELDEMAQREEGKKTVQELSFNSFYEFAKKRLPEIAKEEDIPFNIREFLFVLKRYYRGGEFEQILNEDMNTSLFDEKMIVFEIDNIKDNKDLAPIVTLIIMDTFLQKMRLKPNGKSLIIEEAWKAIASPVMAGYIQYLYKTVRKFHGEAVVVTQEIEDIVSSPIIKNVIINNSAIQILLDQNQYKDNYDEVAKLLALTPVERNKIFTINRLDNKFGRAKFREVYIRRADTGGVYGSEVSPQEYFTYTTERPEKEAIMKYRNAYDSYITEKGEDWIQSVLYTHPEMDRPEIKKLWQTAYPVYEISMEAFLSDLEEFKKDGKQMAEFIMRVNSTGYMVPLKLKHHEINI